MRPLINNLVERIAKRTASLMTRNEAGQLLQQIDLGLQQVNLGLRQIDGRIAELGDRILPQPPQIYASDEEPESYRRRLIEELIAENPGAAAAHKLIVDCINTIEDKFEWEMISSDEVRFLLTYLMVPDGPGRLLEVEDYRVSPALAALKSWTIDSLRPHPDFNLESEILPFEDNSIDGVLLCEIIEHFNSDPMFCLIEINRVLRPNGFIILTTPNAASWFSVYQALQHLHPNRFAVYGTAPIDTFHCIHAREYTPSEVTALLEAAGFEGCEVTTRDYGISAPYLPLPGFDPNLRGETVFCRAYKCGQPKKRYVTPVYVEDKDFDGFAGSSGRNVLLSGEG